MSDEPKPRPRRKLLRIAALSTSAIVAAGLVAGCGTTTGAILEDASSDADSGPMVGRPAQDAGTDIAPGVPIVDAGISVADAGTSVEDAGSE